MLPMVTTNDPAMFPPTTLSWMAWAQGKQFLSQADERFRGLLDCTKTTVWAVPVEVSVRGEWIAFVVFLAKLQKKRRGGGAYTSHAV